ncbi:glutamine synthetase family protein [Desulfoluna spongiiphila]|uniref:L-glutamine synthetase n=1 Tax=Desulfoluna spongiiphila TaxID=419481 RepID=A0A1G5CS80_9BACT|nr:glutamine synthetase family protein [Desulfoluna spongiiphila]SCY05157.1 L-glutamine synthetase [Desulfoluna spongiiphila]VVS92373.1 glutamine synthetase/guanido kinase catalytic domain [Desulfoluna spongiiphila]
MDEVDSQLEHVDCTKLFFTDLNGRLMNLSVNKHKIGDIFENGVGFDGSSIAGFANVEHSDRILMPDADSLWQIPFEEEKVGFFIANVLNEQGAPAAVDPRTILQEVVRGAEEEFGFRFLVGPEHEFFLLNGDEFALTAKRGFPSDVHTDRAGYFHSTPHDKGQAIRQQITDVLERCGIVYEKSHHEVTPSQHEINLECTDPVSAADRTLLFTYVAQRVAQENGFYASFMPKPFKEHNRNAFHMHLSIQDSEGTNLFYDEGADQNLSIVARQFIAGIIKYARETSVVMASTVNSYKAYVVEKEAPIVRGWGFRNRSSMVRVPYTTSPSATRIELRNPDPAGNVYLQMATLIAMGLQGIREKLANGIPDKGSTYDRDYKMKVWDERFLPRTFYEALVEAERSDFLKGFLGDKLYDNFMTLKIQEWEDDRVHISGREQRQYLSI